MSSIPSYRSRSPARGIIASAAQAERIRLRFTVSRGAI
jgi:hypothetical protein